MESQINMYCHNISNDNRFSQRTKNNVILDFSEVNQRKILKAFLLNISHQLISQLFNNKIQSDPNNSSMECYAMDNKIIQLLIQGIIETGEYTLEGIAYATHIPFDVIYDAACNINNQYSVTLWTKIVDLYIQLNPSIAQALVDKLLETKEKYSAALMMQLYEP